MAKEETIPMQKNSANLQQRMDSEEENFLSLRLNLLTTRFMLNSRGETMRNPMRPPAPMRAPARGLERGELIGLVLDCQMKDQGRIEDKKEGSIEVTNLFTQAVELNWSIKIGA